TKKRNNASTATSIVVAAGGGTGARRRGMTGENAGTDGRPATRKTPPAIQPKANASAVLPITSPIDQRFGSKALRRALEKTASALANSAPNTTRDGSANGRRLPIDAIRPPARRVSGRPSSGSAASSTAPPLTMRPATTRPRTTSRSSARRVTGTPAKQTAAIPTNTSIAGTSNRSSMRSLRSVGRNAKITATGTTQRSRASTRAPAGRKVQQRMSIPITASARFTPSGTP